MNGKNGGEDMKGKMKYVEGKTWIWDERIKAKKGESKEDVTKQKLTRSPKCVKSKCA
jgi:predicted sulfurtransferase